MESFGVANFIESLGLTIEGVALANILLKNIEQCNVFFTEYLGRNLHRIDDIFDYREYRIETLSLDVDEFISSCANGIDRDLFENVFLQSFSDCEMKLLKDAIDSEKLSLSAMYNRFSSNPNENVMRYVL
jgi:hypothetical protein